MKYIVRKVSLPAALLLLTTSCHTIHDGYQLVWEENFDSSSELDTAVWSKIPRGKPDWAKCMSPDESCYEVQNGQLILRGKINPDRANDPSPYITGGVYTKYKKAFYHGKLQIRAKLGTARGAWPAIWLKPFEEEKYKWPSGGEIDIMEHLNTDSIVYQTVHSHYTHHLGLKDNPPHGATAPIDKNGYNIYGVEMTADSIVFSVNGQRTFAYPKIATDKEGQFPFDIPYYLLIDMQLGGAWVGKVKAEDLPVEMYIDWVRFYQRKGER